MKTDIEKIFERFERKQESFSLSFNRFKVDGKPTCMAWNGSKDHDRMACRFLGISNFGTQYHCMYLDDKIYTEDGAQFIEPIRNCPFWS